MVNNYVLCLYSEELELWYEAEFKDKPLFDSIYNNAFSKPSVPVIASKYGKLKIGMLQWGLIPHWAMDKNIKFNTYNGCLY